MFLTHDQLELVRDCLDQLRSGFVDESRLELVDQPDMARVLQETSQRLHDNYPYHSPFYLGQMLKPPHPVAQLAYTLAMCLNPNNHAHDGGRVSSEMERECVAQLAGMIGFKQHLGHLCSGGTVANFEALWVARELTGGKGIAVSAQAHYTHERLSKVLQISCEKVPVDAAGRMDLTALESILKRGEIGTVVATLGTTGLGAVDPLNQIVELKKQYPFRLHVDAAYGGYFRLATQLDEQVQGAFAVMEQADSVVIDPHKRGLQPYGCGCILFRDPQVAAIYQHDSPYTYFTSDELHLGEISLECSRAGAAAVALWATMKLFPPIPGGEFSHQLNQTRQAALQLCDWIRQQDQFQLIVEPDLDIVTWLIPAATSSQSSDLARRFFTAAEKQGVHLALLSLSRDFLEPRSLIEIWDSSDVVGLRACVMKSEHLAAMPAILERLSSAIPP